MSIFFITIRCLEKHLGNLDKLKSIRILLVCWESFDPPINVRFQTRQPNPQSIDSGCSGLLALVEVGTLFS